MIFLRFAATIAPMASRPDPAQAQLSIEALRGLAALMVVAAHYVALIRPQGPGLWGLASTGVDLFFVLSGFVFARLLAQPGFSVRAHLLRRALRLYPLYLLALLAYGLLQAPQGRWDALPAHLAMLHTTGSLKTAAAYNVAFWSLPPEVEFYILLPALAVVAAVLARRGPSALWLLLVCALLVKLVLVGLAQEGESLESLRSVLTVHAPGLLIEFLLGSAVAVWGGHLRAPQLAGAWSGAQRSVASALGAAGLLALVWTYSAFLSSPGMAAQAPPWLSGTVGLWAAIGFAALMLGLPGQQASSLERKAVWSWLAGWAGRLSYGVYLFHNAAPQWVRSVFPEVSGWALVIPSFLLTVAVAALLHRWVEWPARRLGRRWAARLERHEG